MEFSVTILGSGSAVPTSRRNPSAQYIQCRNRHFLIDCGEGTQMQIRKLGINFQRITDVFISHLHGDHYFGLVGLLSTMHLMGRVKPIRIYGPDGLQKIIELQLEVSKGKLSFERIYSTIIDGENKLLFEDDKVEVSCFPLRHKIPTSGFLIKEKDRERKLLGEKARQDGVRIEFFHKLKAGQDVEQDGQLIRSSDYTITAPKPCSYAYCSDTAYQKSTADFVKEADVLYHEATFTEALKDRAKATRHSTAKDAAKVASEANVKQLLLGHLSARYDDGETHVLEAKEIFENVRYVEDGEVIVIR